MKYKLTDMTSLYAFCPNEKQTYKFLFFGKLFLKKTKYFLRKISQPETRNPYDRHDVRDAWFAKKTVILRKAKINKGRSLYSCHQTQVSIVPNPETFTSVKTKTRLGRDTLRQSMSWSFQVVSRCLKRLFTIILIHFALRLPKNADTFWLRNFEEKRQRSNSGTIWNRLWV